MSPKLQCNKNGLALSVEVPEAGDQVLRGQLNFSEPKAASSASVELGLISRKHKALPFPEPWMCELEAPATRRTLRPDAEGKADFELKIPPWLFPFKGEWLEIAAVVLVRGEQGTTIRLVVEGMPSPPFDPQLAGLPVERKIKAPLSPYFFAFFLAATLALIFLGFWLANPELHKAAFACGILVFTLAWIALPAAWRWRRLGRFQLRAEKVGEGAESRVKVRGEGAKLSGAGRVRLVAREFLYSDSSLSKFEPLFSRESRLKPLASGGFEAEIAFSGSVPVPPSLCLSRAQTQQGILWELVFDLETQRGGVGEAHLPLRLVPKEPPIG